MGVCVTGGTGWEDQSHIKGIWRNGSSIGAAIRESLRGRPRDGCGGRRLGGPNHIKGIWRNGSASDSRSEGWEFESLCPHSLAATCCRCHGLDGH